MTRVRVLHILGTGRAGGVETFVANAVSSMDAKRFGFCVCIIGGDGAMADEMRASGVPVLTLGVKRRLGPVAIARLVRLLVSGGGFDIVHLHMGGRLLQWIVRAAGRTAVIAHLHGPPLEPMIELPGAESAKRAALRVLGSRPVRVLACNDIIASDLADAIPELRGRIAIVPYGVDTTRFKAFMRGSDQALAARRALGLVPSDFVMAFVGRLVPQKGIDRLADIVERVVAALPALKLVAIGDGPLRGTLESLSHRMGQGRVKLMGERNDVQAWLPACDVLALTSAWESFGIVSLEAMAAARPVVGFAIDGVPKVVDHGESGWLVPAGDTAAFAAAVVELANDPMRRDRMGAAGRLRVERLFTTAHVACRLEHEYATALESRTGGK